MAILLAMLFMGITGNAFAAKQLKYENLLIKNPKGYKIGFSKKSGRMAIAEMIPKGEKIESWSQMLTTQIFFGGIGGRSPKDFYQLLFRGWSRVCPASTKSFIKSGKQNGYRYAMWMYTCDKNPKTRRPENTMFKAMEGNDSFYVVQKSWKYKPSKQDKKKWLDYLAKVRLCDSRIKDRACPQIK